MVLELFNTTYLTCSPNLHVPGAEATLREFMLGDTMGTLIESVYEPIKNGRVAEHVLFNVAVGVLAFLDQACRQVCVIRGG